MRACRSPAPPDDDLRASPPRWWRRSGSRRRRAGLRPRRWCSAWWAARHRPVEPDRAAAASTRSTRRRRTPAEVRAGTPTDVLHLAHATYVLPSRSGTWPSPRCGARLRRRRRPGRPPSPTTGPAPLLGTQGPDRRLVASDDAGLGRLGRPGGRQPAAARVRRRPGRASSATWTCRQQSGAQRSLTRAGRHRPADRLLRDGRGRLAPGGPLGTRAHRGDRPADPGRRRVGRPASSRSGPSRIARRPAVRRESSTMPGRGGELSAGRRASCSPSDAGRRRELRVYDARLLGGDSSAWSRRQLGRGRGARRPRVAITYIAIDPDGVATPGGRLDDSNPDQVRAASPATRTTGAVRGRWRRSSWTPRRRSWPARSSKMHHFRQVDVFADRLTRATRSPSSTTPTTSPTSRWRRSPHGPT